ncbi:ribosome biogenesis GTPase Der [Candidatus Berkelbacteria bacterium CG10_big_fil_rev_8_21_14_0_10_43_13]|uniref:GTPase Der n=1 Tax=Candidatus Berkelbacteria bacterium CG10_big_fil_rev_8_21_14_0_10_43_13 TaxID=1974514 RepID=A0A2H0W7G7_9BACT|nr:MAG: ribosome biogenesis GTPase Der [Candidatus Berkelbacteria bacterium CG10_big_fil_rev_8_21_14_0_10_43_13]
MEKENLKTVALIGRPNVGKSTLFNRLAGKRIAIETPIPGTTRDRLFARVNWQGTEFDLIDVAGVESPRHTSGQSDKTELSLLTQQNIEAAQAEADLILFVVDWTEVDNDADKRIARVLRKSEKPVILVVNKADNIGRQDKIDTFARLGSFPIVPVSAISGSNSGDLLDEIAKKLAATPDSHTRCGSEGEKVDINLAIIGRPNVGKSTLLNSIIGAKRAIVSDVPGTTRDVVDVIFFHKNKKLMIADTAGIRRPGKLGRDTIESYSFLRTEQSLRKSDVAVLVIDAKEELVALDANILGKAKEWGKGIVLAVNKIDQISDEDFVARTLSALKIKLNFVPWLPVVFVSAQDETNLKKLLDLVVVTDMNRRTLIPQPDLDEILTDAKNSNFQLEGIKSLSQKSTTPPVFEAKVSHKKTPHYTQIRYLENRIRDTYPMNGTPIFIDLI